MQISAKTKINDLLNSYPDLVDFFIGKSPKFKHLKNPIMRKTIGKVATLKQVAEMGDLDLELLLDEIEKEIHTVGDKNASQQIPESSQAVTDSKERQEILKGIIRDLHLGVELETLKQRFRELIKDIDPSEIAKMEQSLINEGMPESEVKRLCDVHVAVFQDSLEKYEMPRVPAGHPVHTLLEENRAAEALMEEIDHLINTIESSSDKEVYAGYVQRLKHLVDKLADINLHYLKKENQLFPLMEAKGLSGPPQVMWAIHDDIRAMIKNLKQLLSRANITEAVSATNPLLVSIRDMIYKEDHVLFPMTLDIFSESDWIKVKHGEAEVGYAWIEPVEGWRPEMEEKPAPEVPNDAIHLDTGLLSAEAINLMLTHLPVDLTFVNDQDEVAYYSQGKERIFARSPGIIGRKVQKCHPPKSVHIVEEILKKMKSGKRDQAEFWLQLGGKFIYIRYFAVRNAHGEYKGCLEVSQDVTEIRKLEGEQRLLQWQ